MKKLFLLLTLLGAVTISAAQDLHKRQVPSVVLNQFEKQFPKAKEVEWEKSGELYKVEFETNWSNDHDVWYNAEGKMVKHKEELSSRNLPKSIQEYLSKEYKYYKIDDVERITENDEVIYKVEVERRDREIKLLFHEDGSLIN